MRVFQHRTAGVAAMESHEGLGQAHIVSAPDGLVVNGCGHGVVDVQQRGGRAGNAHADVLGQRAVNIHLAGNGNSHGRKAAVYITGHKFELRLERGPALVGKRHILPRAFVGLGPVQQRQLVLGQTGQNTRILVVSAQLRLHLGHFGRNARVVRMLVVGDQ